jgi:hypothetical protein
MQSTAAFWFFGAVVVLAGIWQRIVSRREAEKTIRLAIEHGQPLSPALIERLLGPRRNQGLLVRGAVALAVGVGLVIMGFLINVAEKSSDGYIVVGMSAVFFLVGVALLVVWSFTRRNASTTEPDGAST